MSTPNGTDEQAATSSTLNVALEKHRRLAWLESLRGLAACYVVLHHVRMVTGDVFLKSSFLVHQIDYYIFGWGHFAVALFIVLSGFVLMLPIVTSKPALESDQYMLRQGSSISGILAFYRSRAWRILPPYYLSLLLSVILIALGVGLKYPCELWDSARAITPHGIVTHLLMLQDIFQSDWSQFSCVLWSISVEFRIYLLFPLLLVGFTKFGPIRTTIFAVVFGNLCAWAAEHCPGMSPSSSFHFLGLFAGGALCCDMLYGPLGRRLQNRKSFLPALYGRAGIAALGFLAVAFLMTRFAQPARVYDNMVGLSVICLLLDVAVRGNSGLRRLLERKSLIFLGTFAYSIYLVHFPFLVLIWDRIIAPMHQSSIVSLLLMFLIAAPASVVMAYVYFRLCEKPFHSLAKRQGTVPIRDPENAFVARSGNDFN